MKPSLQIIGILFVLVSSGALAQQNTLTWVDPNTNETTHHIERKAEICAGPGAFTEIATVGANVTTYVDNAVSQGQFYCYRVAASNTAGKSAYSNLAGRLVPFVVPSAPSNLNVGP